MAPETVQVGMNYYSSSKSLSLPFVEPYGKNTSGHKEIYLNERGLLRNVNSLSQQPPAINNTETVCIIYTTHP